MKPLDMKLNKLVEAVSFFKRALATLHQALGSGGDQDGRIAKTLVQMGPPVSDALFILDDLRVTMGTAQVVETGDGKAKIQ